MNKYARIENGTALEVFTPSEGLDIADCFHADIAAQFLAVPDTVLPGWVCGSDGKWAAPATPEPLPVYPKVGPIAFQMLFHVEELVAIDAAKETDPVVRIFWNLLNDPRTDIVDRNLKTVQDSLHYLEAKSLIGAGRAQEILTGEVTK